MTVGLDTNCMTVGLDNCLSRLCPGGPAESLACICILAVSMLKSVSGGIDVGTRSETAEFTLEGSTLGITCGGAFVPCSLNALLSNSAGIPGSTLRRLRRAGAITVNGHIPLPDVELVPGTTVLVDLSAAEQPSDLPPDAPLPEIVYEDGLLIAVNKPPLTVVHPTCFHQSGTSAAGIARYYRDNNIRAGIHFVNRLDLGTSGLLLAAKCGFMQEYMRRQAEAGRYSKTYLGICERAENGPGDPELAREGARMTVDAPISRDLSSIILRKIDPDGKRAVTEVTVLAVSGDRRKILAAFSLLTGRTHQIRVHMSYKGWPLSGDTLYGAGAVPRTARLTPDEAEAEAKKPGSGVHQLLHAWSAGYIQPFTGEKKRITCPVPQEFIQEFPEAFDTSGELAGAPLSVLSAASAP